ncbi:protein SIX6OS1 [Emydura macquarii macquarii]|uniref:protein SIX6OS1 n=1 Tax=Emydura macquarii macquarii TaxID=1129001 RepID=UPI00352A5DD8
MPPRSIGSAEESQSRVNEEDSLDEEEEENRGQESGWKPTYVVLSKHEEYLNNQLKNCQETTESDKKMYQDYMNQFKETLKQHQAKYSESALAQEYYMKKKDIEEIRDRVLKHSEQFKLKEATLLDILGTNITTVIPASAYLRKKTQEVLKHAAVFTQNTFELEKEADEVEMKINYFKQQFERSTEDQSHSKIIEGKSKKNLEKRKEFKERLFEEIGNLHLLHGKYQQHKPLHLPCIPQKLVQSVQTFRLSLQRTETGGEERDNSMDHSGIASISSNQVDNETQNVHTECFIKSSEDNPEAAEGSNEHFPQTPEMPLFIRTPESSGKKAQFSKTAPFEFPEGCSPPSHSVLPNAVVWKLTLCLKTEAKKALRLTLLKSMKLHQCTTIVRRHNLGCEGQEPKSPAFSFLMSCTQKSPGFNLFDSSVFGAENSSDQTDESYSAGNVNPISPQKDIGSLFGKLESEDAFTFSFPSESSSHTYGDGKDDFSFPFAFGQDQRSSHSSSLKGFHSSSQNKKPFTFF